MQFRLQLQDHIEVAVAVVDSIEDYFELLQPELFVIENESY